MKEGLPNRCCYHRQKGTNITKVIDWLERGEIWGSKCPDFTLLLLLDVLPFLPIFQTQLETRNHGSSGNTVCKGHLPRAVKERQEMDLETYKQIGLCCCCCLVTSVMSDFVQLCGLQPNRILCTWDSPGKNTGVSCHALLQGIFSTQESNFCLLCLLHWQAGSLQLSHQRTPKWVYTSI